MDTIIGYKAKYNLPKMAAGDLFSAQEKWCKGFPEIIEPVYEFEPQQKTIEQMVIDLENKIGVLKMYIKNL